MLESQADQRTSKKAVASLAEVDFALAAQLIVAWAGEAGEEKRLGWWRTDLASEFGGEDLFKRLLPNSWQWATLQGVREVARRKDAELRRTSPHHDQMLTLFALGFELDERLDERLLDLKRSGLEPVRALPGLTSVIAPTWDESAFLRWAAGMGSSRFETEPNARRLVGDAPSELREVIAKLVGAMVPRAPSYPLPYIRRAR